MAVETKMKEIFENMKRCGSGAKEKANSSFWVLLFFVGILVVLLLVSLGIITCSSLEIKKQKLKISKLELVSERLCREKEKFDQKLRFILTSSNFSVSQFCSNRECRLCSDGWVWFQNKCYMFSNDSDPSLTWEKSRQYCQKRSGDLVVINDLEEQAFISNLSTTYYWLGLEHIDDEWLWIDGCKDTLGLWIDDLKPFGSYAEVMAWRNLTNSWLPTTSSTLSKVVCEQEAFTVFI